MKIKVVGAAGGEVTGSAYVVETKSSRILVDCGLFQGGKRSEALNRPPANPNMKLDAVLLTHGHLDHTGRLPLLTKLGWRGPVFATPATAKMAALIVRDSARLQVGDAQRQTRKNLRMGKPPVEPLYTPEEADGIIGQMQTVPYQKPVDVAPGIRATWAEAGHMLGSTSIQLLIREDGKEKKVVFSGDLGPRSIPLLRNFDPFKHADLLFLESTYGDRDHRDFLQTVEEFVAVVQKAVKAGGKIIVPTFAVGRAQLLTSLLGWMSRKKKISPFPIFLDSPMAIEATKIYTQHRELFHEKMDKFIREKPLREELRTMKMCATADDSKKINDVSGTCLIMAGAGMCNGGRVLHHLKQNLWKPETQVLIVGYQGRGSLGRQLVDGVKEVRIHGEKVAVKARVHTLSGFSAHAGQTDLLNWFGVIAPSKPRVILTHGEDGPRQELARQIQRRYQLKCTLPAMGDVIDF
ncbi:MAG TPA: MBL fold metallo-hydrolase [Phycisphaerae bacterium]|nr:MBL fold metallo-hydrolase [Phycisphaerae bacterium]